MTRLDFTDKEEKLLETASWEIQNTTDIFEVEKILERLIIDLKEEK